MEDMKRALFFGTIAEMSSEGRARKKNGGHGESYGLTVSSLRDLPPMHMFSLRAHLVMFSKKERPSPCPPC
jgi:hypothetical protein